MQKILYQGGTDLCEVEPVVVYADQAPPPRPPDLSTLAYRYVREHLADEHGFSDAFHHTCDGGNGDGTRHDCAEFTRGIVQYAARELQLHIDAVVAELTGRPMPAGPVHSPMADNWQEPEMYRADFPDLPPVGGAQ